MSRSLWAWGRYLGSVAVLAVLVWRLGSGPFLDGVRAIDGPALAAATVLVALTTVFSAWRWKIVAEGLGADLSLHAAVAAYYRALFLNVTLPGGIVGDVHRGVSHGRDVNDLGRAMRAVAWERGAGQVVQTFLTMVALLALPSPVQSDMPLVAIVFVMVLFSLALMARWRPADPRSVWARTQATVGRDFRQGILKHRARWRILLASVLVVAGHAAIFLIAARTAGITAPLSRMLPIALLVVMAMVLPNIGGWGPREGIAAWLFAAAGLGAGRGVTTAVVYGVMVVVACLPGAGVLVMSWFRGARPSRPHKPPFREGAASA